MAEAREKTEEQEAPASQKIRVQLPLEIDEGVLNDFPREVADEFGVVPLGKIAGKSFILAASSELSNRQIKKIRKRVGWPIHVITMASAGAADAVHRVFNPDQEPQPGPEPEVEPEGESPELEAGEMELEELTSAPLEELEELERIDDLEEEEEDEQEEEDIDLEKLLESARRAQEASSPRRLSEIFVDLGFISAEELEDFLKESTSEEKDFFDPSPFIDAQVIRLIPQELASEHQLLPLLRVKDELLVAAGSYLDAGVVSRVKKLTGLMPKLIITDVAELEAGIKECYRRRAQLKTEEMRLGEYLMSKGYLNRVQLQSCLKEQADSRQKLGELIVRRGYVPEDVIYKYLAERLGYEYRRFNTSDIDVELSRLVSQKFAERNLVVPLALEQAKRELEIAMAEPYDLKVIDTIRNIMGHRGYKIRPVLSSPSNIKEGISYSYNFREMFEDKLEMETIQQEIEMERRDLVNTEDLPQIRKIINQILYRAVVEGASDVHIENLENRVRVRFRLDGLLQERKTSITKDNIRSVCSVFKVDAALDITEHRRSQDGVFKMRIGKDHLVDFRLNLHATDFGQDAVIRILDTSKNLFPLESVGLDRETLRDYYALIENPQGLILFVGPTGSGKSTTLYSTLAHLNSDEKKVVTAEDPVEYYLDGICQYKVNEAIGNTFAEYGRRFLRKDPDIILIGEIRDEDTADACFKAATTGHLVFSTLHTNDSVGVVLRLKHLGVEPSIIGESLLAVISQRLARRNCTKCLQPYEPDPELVDLFYPEGPPGDAEFAHGAGCPTCDYLGYKGRTGLYEYWELSPDVIFAIINEEKDVRSIARRSGLRPLIGDGLRKVQQGVSTLEELRRTVPLEQIRAYRRHYARSA